MSSEIVLTGPHCAAARAILRMTQADLHQAAGVAEKTIRDFEAGHRYPRRETIEKLRQAFEWRGIEFYNGDEPGVRLRPSRAIIPAPSRQ